MVRKVSRRGNASRERIREKPRYIPFYLGFEIGSVPSGASPACRSREGSGISARYNSPNKSFPQTLHAAALEPATE